MILFSIFKIVGYKNASKFGANIGKTFGKLIRSDKIILKNLNLIKKNSQTQIMDDKKIVNEVFENYGRILSDYVYLKKFKSGLLKKYLHINGEHHLNKIKEENKKVVFISGHFNNFELMAMYLDSSNINLAAIYRPLNNIFLNYIMEKIRINHICKHQIKKGKNGTRDLIKFLKKNYSIALMIDQRVTEGIKSELFGVPAFTTTIPAQIVKKFNCEIVPVYIERNNDIEFNLNIEEPLKFDDKLSIEEITLKLNKILEKMILRRPSQWILTHNRWK